MQRRNPWCRSASASRRSWPAMLSAALVTVPLVTAITVLVPSGSSDAVTVSPSATPAFAGDAGDPDVVYSAGTYFAFSTGTPLGNHIQALVSSSASGGYHSYTG